VTQQLFKAELDRLHAPPLPARGGAGGVGGG
jgi:hypothetical protein